MRKITLPSLVTLRILVCPNPGSREPQIEFLKAILAPMLQTLVLEDISPYEIQQLNHDKPDLPMLRSLAIAPTRDSPQDVRLLLDSIFPDIIHLNVRSSMARASWFFHPSSSVQFCPRLEVLTLHELPCSQVTPFCQSLVERSMSCSLPRKIFLRNCDASVVNTFLTSLRDLELHIEVYSNTGGDVPWYEAVETRKCW